jgi:hypothetical protein
VIGHYACVGETCNHNAIWAAFAHRKWDIRSRAIADAFSDPHADELLARMLDTSNDQVFEKVMLAAHLGDLHGDAGVAALERATEATGQGSRDLRCAALIALAKRCGAEATPLFRDALATRDGAVKDYAVMALDAVGDGRAWQEVADRLQTLVRRDTSGYPYLNRGADYSTPEELAAAIKQSRRNATRGQPSEVLTAVAYLGQHLESDRERTSRVVGLIRKHWGRRDAEEQGWFRTYWPDAPPAGPPANAVRVPGHIALNEWVRATHLFEPLPSPG